MVIFSSLLDVSDAEESSAASKPSNVVATSDISSMLALQEVSEEELRRKKIIKHGDAMLDSLEDLRRHLLVGTLPLNVLNDINAQLLIQKQQIVDPRLLEIISDIELRTAVELAKLEMAIASKSVID